MTRSLLEGLLYVLPALVLLGILLFGRRPGERLVIALHARRVRRRHASRQARVRTRPSELLAPRGGRLIAAALAGRAPPVICVASGGA